jgi:hypothetical protein
MAYPFYFVSNSQLRANPSDRPVGKLLAMPLSILSRPALISREWLILEHAMKHQRHFDTTAAAERETTQILNMIDQLYRRVRLLNADIVTEELRLRIFDRADAAYPILAQTLAERRDNLLKTIDALNKRLPMQDQVERFAEMA